MDSDNDDHRSQNSQWHLGSSALKSVNNQVDWLIISPEETVSFRIPLSSLLPSAFSFFFFSLLFNVQHFLDTTETTTGNVHDNGVVNHIKYKAVPYMKKQDKQTRHGKGQPHCLLMPILNGGTFFSQGQL